MRLHSVTAALLIGLANFTLPSESPAQTSFGADRAPVAATTRAEWMAQLDAALMNAVRHANSSLAVFRVHNSLRLTVTVVVAPDGRLVEMMVTQTSGRPSVDAAVMRALSRVTQVQPFTPDMPDQAVITQLQLGTTTS